MSAQARKKRKSRSEAHISDPSVQKPSCSLDAKDDCPSSITLQPGQVAYFEGEAQVSVKGGAIWLNGTFLEASAAPIAICADAVLGGALPIEAIPSGTQVPHPHQDVEVAFESVPGSGDGAAAGDADVASPAAASWRVLPEGTCAAHHAPQDWREAAAGISATVHEACASGRGGGRTVAVCGAKGTGKSSFGRLLGNCLLNGARRIAWLDADCGQPEFNSPGIVSLTYLDRPVYGAPHMHQRSPSQARFVGHLSPERDPVAYRGAVQDLLSWHAAHHASTPLLINTCGWTKGLGFDLLEDLLQSAGPSHVVLLQTANARRNLPAEPFWAPAGGPAHVPAPACALVQLQAVGQLPPAPAAPLLQLPGVPPAPKKQTATEARSLSWLVWARKIVGLPTSGVRWEADTLAATAMGLAARVPFAVQLSDVTVEVVHASVAPDQLGCVLNGALVGLCSRNAAADTTPESRCGRAATVCLGVGIVRAVDMARGSAFVLAPLDLETMQKVNVLQVGRLELPPELLQSGVIVSPYLSTWSIATAGTGAGVIKSRNNLLRVAQLVG